MTRAARVRGDPGRDRPRRAGIRAWIRARLTGQPTPPYSCSPFPREGRGDARGGSFLLPLVTLFIFNSPPSCSDMTPPGKRLLVLSQHPVPPR